MTTDHVGQEVVGGFGKAVLEAGADFLKSLVGKTADEARKLVQDGGFKLREMGKNDMGDMMFDEGRITLVVDGGVVDSASAG